MLRSNHKMVSNMEDGLVSARKAYVERKQRNMTFGGDRSWRDVEADETTSARTVVEEAGRPQTKKAKWEQWVGIAQRGRPESVLSPRLIFEASI